MPTEIKLWNGKWGRILESNEKILFGCSKECDPHINDTLLQPLHVTLTIHADTVSVCINSEKGVWISYKKGRGNVDVHIVDGEMCLDHSFEMYFYKMNYERQHLFRIEFTNSEDTAGSKRPRSDDLVPVKFEH
jgi:hypothetical protein